MRNQGPPTHGAPLCKRASERVQRTTGEGARWGGQGHLAGVPGAVGLQVAPPGVNKKRNEKKKKKPLGWGKETVMTHGTTSTYGKNRQMENEERGLQLARVENGTAWGCGKMCPGET